MRTWLQQEGLATEDELDRIEHEERTYVTAGVERAWNAYKDDLGHDVAAAVELLSGVAAESTASIEIEKLIQGLKREQVPRRRPIEESVFQTLRLTRYESGPGRQDLLRWYEAQRDAWQTPLQQSRHQPIGPISAKGCAGTAPV